MTPPDAQDRIVAACDTGPLLSAFQCDGVDWLRRYFSHIYVAPSQPAEFIVHGAGEEFQALLDERFAVIAANLSNADRALAMYLAERIAAQPTSGDPVPASHLPEAEMLVIATRPEHKCKIVLLDEKAARSVAAEMGLRVTGFPGILAHAGQSGLMTSNDIRRMLKQCQEKGTHYSNALIEHVAKTYGA